MVDPQTPNDDEDTAGHRASHAVPDEDDTQGHRASHAIPDDDDTEGHVKMNTR